MATLQRDQIGAWPDLAWALTQAHRPVVAQWELISGAGPADPDHVARHVIDAAVSDIGDLADQLARAQARIAELEAQLFDYEVEYGVCPMDLVDYSPNTARATVIAAARTMVFAEVGERRLAALTALKNAVRNFDRVDRAAWRATLLAHTQKEAPDGR